MTTFYQSTGGLVKKFLALDDEQKLAVIKKLNNNKNVPAQLISSLQWLYEMSKSKTRNAIFDEITKN